MSKALYFRDKINEKPKDPRFATGLGTHKKHYQWNSLVTQKASAFCEQNITLIGGQSGDKLNFAKLNQKHTK